MRLYKYLLLSFFFYFSCKPSPGNIEVTQLDVNLEKIEDISLFHFFSKLELSSLETNSESLLSFVSSMKLVNDKLYFIDLHTNSILVFGVNGEFLFKIANQGEGPEEYANISDFYIDPEFYNICVLSSVEGVLYTYGEDNHFVSKLILPQITGSYRYFYPLNSDTVVFWTEDYSNRVKYYSKTRDEIVLETFSEPWKDRTCSKEFLMAGYLLRSLTNEVFQIKDEGIRSFYKWNFGSINNDIKKLPDVDTPTTKKYFNDIYSSSTVNYAITGQFMNKKYIYAKIVRKNIYYDLFYDKETGESFYFDKTSEGVTFYPVYMDDEFLLGVAERDITQVLNPSFLEGENLSVFENYNPEDNPILVKYYFKK